MPSKGQAINIFDDDRGIARFLLDGLPADERQHVIDIVSAQHRDDLRRLREQGLPKPRPVLAEVPASVTAEDQDSVV